MILILPKKQILIWLMRMAPSEEPINCIKESQLLKHENEIVELQTRADFKDRRITELNENIHEMDKKLDDIKDRIQELQLRSIVDDSDIDNRVTALENTVKVLKWVSATLIAFLGIAIAALSFSLMHLH